MGEFFEMVQDGTLCEGCGVYLGGAPFSRCAACKKEDRQAPAPDKPAKVRCERCERMVGADGLKSHMGSARCARGRSA